MIRATHAALTPALKEALSLVGTGKKGSKDLPTHDIEKIKTEILTKAPSQISLAAFYTSLWMKGLTEEENSIPFFDGKKISAENLFSMYGSHLPIGWQHLCKKLLDKQILTREESYQLGQYFFSDNHFDEAKAMCASILRMRYTEAQEYAGFLDAAEGICLPLNAKVILGAKSVILAEPFDGSERSYLMTPLLAKALQKNDWHVVHMMGRSSGPKYGVNLLDIVNQIQHPLPSEWGTFILQKDLHPVFDHWVEIRRQTLKRPFMATLEKYINPLKAKYFIGSAFHLNYVEKMVEIAEQKGFLGALISFRTMEGSLGPSLARGVQFIGTRKNADGSYERKKWNINPEDYGFDKQADAEAHPTAEHCALLIQQFSNKGVSEDPYFNDRVNYAQRVYVDLSQWLTYSV